MQQFPFWKWDFFFLETHFEACLSQEYKEELCFIHVAQFILREV